LKLSVSVITDGQYYPAGANVPKNKISDAMRKYAVIAAKDDFDDLEFKPKQLRTKTKLARKLRR